jgi:hypothetical protein
MFHAPINAAFIYSCVNRLMKIEWVDEIHQDDKAAVPLQQSAVYAQAMRALGVRVRGAVIEVEGRYGGQTLMLERPGLRLISRGPVWPEDLPHGAKLHALRRLARQGAAVVATPEQALAGFGLVPLITPRHLALWDLTGDEADLRAGLHPKWRNALCRCEARGLGLSRGGRGKLSALVAAEAAQRAARAYHALPHSFLMGLPERALRLWHWSQDGQMQAGMCFIRHGLWASYHLAHASARARDVGVHRLMLWQAMLALRAEGVRMLDLGDVNTSQTPGLARFKLGTGADLHRLGATAWVLPA